jgi:hypothetical protein
VDKHRKIELVERSLGIRHKLKVHESMKAPDNHEDLAMTLLAKWELEDELRAIEELLADARIANVSSKRAIIEREGTHFDREDFQKTAEQEL